MGSLRVLYVNWAPLWLGAQMGGGVNLYQQSIAVELAKRGHTVASISSGWQYRFPRRIGLREAPTHEGVANWVIVNGSVLAPGFYNFETPELDASAPDVEILFDRVLERFRPDLVHFNNLEGFTPRCIEQAAAHGARVVYSLHNYHPVCNQVHLLYQDREVCRDFDGGRRCLDCITPPPKGAEVQVRRVRELVNSLPLGHRLIGPARGLRNAARRVAHLRRSRGPLADAVAPATPLTTTPTHPSQGERYARRRAALVAGINRADTVLAVSSSVRDVYREMGVDPVRMAVCHIGTQIASKQPLPRRTPRPQAGDSIHLVFIGLAAPWKGLPLLLEALALLPAETLKRLNVHIHALGVTECSATLDALDPLLGQLDFHDGYRHEELAEILRDADVGVVPPLWWDTAPQVVFELLALGVPVLGARIGGIPDFVVDGVNGLLFEPGNPTDLANRLRSVVENPHSLQKLRSGITPMKTLTVHADELEGVYAGGRS